MLALGRTGNVRGDKEKRGENKEEARREWFMAGALFRQHANTGVGVGDASSYSQ